MALGFGLKVPVNDVGALVATVRILLAETESTIQMGQKNARRWVESDFNTGAMADPIYNALLGALK